MPIFVGAAQSSFAKSDGGVGVSQVTTSQRDAISNPEAGQLIYNTTTGNLQIYDGSAWAAVYEPPMAGDGGNSANGIEPGNGYKYHTFTNSGSITFSGSPGTAQILVVGGGGGGGGGGANGSSGGPGIGGPGVQLPTAWDASAIGYAHGQGRYYAGGGSGGTQNTITTSPAPGGTGGGGRGHSQNTGPNSGAANGSGGAGGCGVPAPNARAAGAPGGKGIVVIRYSA